MGEYRHTSSQLARDAQVTSPTIVAYAKAGLLDFIVIGNGVRLFRTGQAQRVRRQFSPLRLANRGTAGRPGQKRAPLEYRTSAPGEGVAVLHAADS